MLVHPEIDPIIFQIGPVALRWYGLMYLLGFAGFYFLMRSRLQRADSPFKNTEQISDFLFYGALGVILGGRVGYCLFYAPSLLIEFTADLPFWGVLRITDGGMSFHGGALGVIAAVLIYAWRYKIPAFKLGDFIAPAIPVGLFFGRVGNFINGELWGRTTDAPWGMVFRGAGPLPRHPSMLYEAFLEGIVLFCILWFVSLKPRSRGMISGLFLVFYGLFRFMVEFVREPDDHLGFLVMNWLTMGMLLSLPMIILGLLFIYTVPKLSKG